VIEPAAGFRRIRSAAQHALALDSSLADAHGTLALVLMHVDQNWPEAERQFHVALELDPNNAQVRHDYAHFLLAVRRTSDAAAESERAVALDPVDAGLESCLGWHELSGQHYDSAVAQSLRAVAAAPEFFWAHQTLGWSYEQVGRYPEAIASLRRAAELSGGLPFTQASLGHALAMAGDRAVSGARIDFHQGTEFASLWGGGTLESWRGKGIYSSMVAYRARLAAERGYRYLRVDALPTSAPILTRLGFVQLSTTVPYVFTPPTSSTRSATAAPSDTRPTSRTLSISDGGA